MTCLLETEKASEQLHLFNPIHNEREAIVELLLGVLRGELQRQLTRTGQRDDRSTGVAGDLLDVRHLQQSNLTVEQRLLSLPLDLHVIAPLHTYGLLSGTLRDQCDCGGMRLSTRTMLHAIDSLLQLVLDERDLAQTLLLLATLALLLFTLLADALFLLVTSQ